MKTFAQFLKTLSLAALAAGLSWAALATSARAQSAGSLDSSFNAGTGANDIVISVAVQADGKVLIGGDPFTQVEGVSRPGLARLNTDGSVDTGFVPDATLFSSPLVVNAIAVQGNGQIIIGGSFGFARLNADGSRDTSFSAAAGTVYNVLILPNGQVLIGGGLLFNADGSADSAFATNLSGSVYASAAQSNGQIIVGGSFSDGTATNVARLNADGSLDSTFNTGTGADDDVESVAVQADGKVLLVGYFDQFNGVAKPGIVRLNSDGSIDSTFSGTNTRASIFRSVAVQSDGKIVIGGFFEIGNGTIVYRLNSDGSNDTSFVPSAGLATEQSDALILQTNGQIIITSEFGQVFRVNGDSGSNAAFFDGEVTLSDGVYYLAFPNGNYFGYYSYLTDPDYIYHFDLGYEYIFDAMDGNDGVYLYDFASNDFFYTSPGFPFPYLYDFGLGSTVYYYPDPSNPGHYNTNGIRYFYDFNTGQIISK